MRSGARECLDEYLYQTGSGTSKFPSVLEEFNPHAIQHDLDILKQTIQMCPSTQTGFSNTKDYAEYLQLQSAFRHAGATLLSLTQQSPSQPNSLAGDQLLSIITHLLQIASDAPLIANEITILEIIKRASQWELACSFRFLYCWHTTIGPEFIQPLVEVHLKGQKSGHGGLDKLVEHVLKYLSTFTSRSNHRHSRGFFGTGVSFYPKHLFLSERGQLQSLPADLYGLLSSPSKVPISLPANFRESEQDPTLRTKQLASSTLQRLFWDHCITVPLERLDQAMHTRHKQGKTQDSSGDKQTLGPSDQEKLKKKALLRGALMDALVGAAGGDEAILASQAAYKMACDPFKVLKLGIGDRANRLTNAIHNGSTSRLQDLTAELRLFLSQNNTTLSNLSAIGQLISQALSACTPKLISPPPQPPSLPNPTPPRNVQTSCQPKARKKARQQPVSQFDTGSSPDHSSVSFAFIALILREACNRARGLPPANMTLFNALCGVDTNGRQKTPPEKMDPIRASSAYAKLMQEHLPSNKLTSRIGISAILTYVISGQSSPTKVFLDTFRGCFFDRNTCERSFKAAIDHNKAVVDTSKEVEAKRDKEKRLPAHITGEITFQNPAVWGQTCCHLTIYKPDNQELLSQRLDEFFSAQVQDAWIQWLGDLADKDPAERGEDQRKPWGSALDFVQGLNIAGCKSGLTPVQLANSLCLAGIVKDPTKEEIVTFISKNLGLGAYRGLELLGFQLHGSSRKNPSHIRNAFSHVYRFLDEHLTDSDKDLLHFGVMFVEHLLCKVVRWDLNLKVAGGLAHHVSDIGRWTRGENEVDNMAFPVPPSWM